MEIMATYKEVIKESIKYFNGDEMAAKVFADKYALKDGDIYYELTPNEMHKRLAGEFARIEKKYPNSLDKDTIYGLFENFRYIIPQGSPMSAIGNPYNTQSASNCFVIDSAYDSMGGIHRTDEEQAQLMKRRGGVGHDISNIRPSGLPVANAAKTTDGIGVYMDRFSNTTREVAQSGRRGALLEACSVHHPEIETFINIKRDKTRITGANISVKLTDEFMNAVKNGTDYEQRWPVDSDNPSISKMVDARSIWNQIIFAAWESAEPGLLFWDNALKYTPSDIYGDFGFRSIATNPCGEIVLPAYDSCRLICENLKSFVINPFTKKAYFDYVNFIKITKIAQRLMDDMIDIELEQIDKILAKVESDPEPYEIKRVELELWNKIKETCLKGRRTGLGITALGDALAALNIRYGSDESIEVTEKIYKTLEVSAYESSIELAEERGSFPIFNYELEKDHVFVSRVISNLPIEVQEKYKKFGRRNIALTTTAPTGSVSMMTQTTSGIEPVFAIKYSRRKKINLSNSNEKVDYIDSLGDKWQVFEVYHEGFKQWMDVTGYTYEDFDKSPYYKATANDVDWLASVKIQAVAQKWICHSISKTCNLPNSATKELVADIYMKAWESGCKGFTVYRDGCRDGVLITKKETKNEECTCGEVHSITRPKRLECDIHQAIINSQAWTIFIGKLDGKPYELFGGLSSKVELPKKIKHGFLDRCGKNDDGLSIYELVYSDGDETGKIKDVVNMFENPTQGAFTRMISLLLRIGTPIHIIVEQIQKDKASDMYSFSRIIARVLKKYIKDGTSSKQKCPNCGGDISYIEGCLMCTHCGYAKCG
jgi:ribonucleoside-diphosphate reductase alpha chain